MIEILRSILIGAIQGVSEFLPISSSGHLILFQNFFHLNPNGKLAFDVALHFGTAIAIVLYFWRDWLLIIARGLKIKSQAVKSAGYDPELKNYPDNLLWQIIVASIPAAILGILLNDYVDTKLSSNILIATNLVIFGFVLWYVDKKAKNDFKPKHLGYKQTFLIGLAQAVALMPGVSRSGITMSAARAQGMNRESAARFSFLLSTPAMLGAFLLNLRHIEQIKIGLPFYLSIISATLFGLLAIKYLLQYLKKSDFGVFLWYRVIVAIVVIVLFFAR